LLFLNLVWVDLKWVFFAFAKNHLFFLILVVAAVPDLAGGGEGIPFGEKVVSGYEEKAKGLSSCLLLGTCWAVVVVLR